MDDNDPMVAFGNAPSPIFKRVAGQQKGGVDGGACGVAAAASKQEEEDEVGESSDPIDVAQVWDKDIDWLLYHLGLLEVLTACSIGKNNIAEAKCQLYYPFEDLMAAILDTRTTLPVRTVLIDFFTQV